MDRTQMNDFKEDVRGRNPIEVVLQNYGVRLRRAGRRCEYVGLCPLHADQKTESLHVYADQGRWWCYGGCVAPNKGGDVFKFVMLMERCDFKRALDILANGSTARQPLSRSQTKTAKPKADNKLAFSLSEEHCGVLGAATAMYHARLARAAHALAFLQQRCIREDTIRNWRIGYADGTQLLRHLQFRQTDMRLALEVGLVRQGREHLRGRLIFPSVRDGRVQFLIGRALAPGQKPPYLGLPIPKPLYYDGCDTEVFHHDEVILVEGPLDLLTLWQWPAYRRQYALIALQGTYLGAEAMPLFERFERIWAALDADAGGSRALEWLSGLWPARVRPVALPKGQDVNDLGQQAKGECVFAECLYHASVAEGRLR